MFSHEITGASLLSGASIADSPPEVLRRPLVGLLAGSTTNAGSNGCDAVASRIETLAHSLVDAHNAEVAALRREIAQCQQRSAQQVPPALLGGQLSERAKSFGTLHSNSGDSPCLPSAVEEEDDGPFDQFILTPLVPTPMNDPPLLHQQKEEGSLTVVKESSGKSDGKKKHGQTCSLADDGKHERIVWRTKTEKVGTGFCSTFFRIRKCWRKQFVDTSAGMESALGHRPLWRILESRPCKTICRFVILCQVIWIGVSTQRDLSSAIEGENLGRLDFITDSAFSAWFAIELFFRIFAERSLFIFGVDRNYNLLDFILVLATVFSTVLTVSVQQQRAGTDLRWLRVFRIFRILRVIHKIQNFRIMVQAIFFSIKDLCWAFVVLVFFHYSFAIVFMNGVSNHLRLKEDLAVEDSSRLKTMFGTVVQSLLVLFQSISGGLDWEEVYNALYRVDWVYGFLFFFYIYFMLLLVMNVVVGTVVKTTSEVFRRDREQVVEEEITKLKIYTKEIKEFFKEADRDGSGTLSWEEFETYLQDNKVKAYFQTLDLDLSQAHVLFTLLDTDDSDEIAVSEFVDGCLRLKGGARSIDVNMLLLQVEKMIFKLIEFSECVDARFDHIYEQLGFEKFGGMSIARPRSVLRGTQSETGARYSRLDASMKAVKSLLH
eukprot:TRINITY_DN12289_c0_g1_i1.p1 TRINITY_DN12289_c0_g1~~TRINITY_DN12289_c0_g1_i1.p1  ORF type:complete len:659 (+),score=114.32 TRINITY_DN12289_c0_g1_i1:162-2138(+)